MRTKTTKTPRRPRYQVALNRVIKRFPTLTAMAEELGVSYQRVQHWRRRGVPLKFCRPVAELSGGTVRPHQLLNVDLLG